MTKHIFPKLRDEQYIFVSKVTVCFRTTHQHGHVNKLKWPQYVYKQTFVKFCFRRFRSNKSSRVQHQTIYPYSYNQQHHWQGPIQKPSGSNLTHRTYYRHTMTLFIWNLLWGTSPPPSNGFMFPLALSYSNVLQQWLFGNCPSTPCSAAANEYKPVKMREKATVVRSVAWTNKWVLFVHTNTLTTTLHQEHLSIIPNLIYWSYAWDETHSLWNAIRTRDYHHRYIHDTHVHNFHWIVTHKKEKI